MRVSWLLILSILLVIDVTTYGFTPIYHQYERTTEYTRVGVNIDDRVVFGAFGSDPSFTESILVDNDHSVNTLWNATMMGSLLVDGSVARGINTNMSSDNVNAASIVFNKLTNETVVLGLNLRAKSHPESVIWEHTVAKCVVAIGMEPVVISDDGSTVAVGCFDNGVAKIVAFSYDGTLLFNVSLKGSPQFEPTFLKMSRHGDFISCAVGTTIFVVTKSGSLWGRVERSYVGPYIMCPMGHFIVTGFEKATIFRFNGTSYAVWFDVVPENGEWFLTYVETSVNGGPDNPDGCLTAIGWTSSDTRQTRIDLYSMKTKKYYWTWESPRNTVDQTIVSGISMHETYIGVSAWGAPTLLLFDIRSPKPLMAYTTPGSMFDVKIGRHDDTLYLVGGGKHVQANIMGDGGDLYVFNFNTTSFY